MFLYSKWYTKNVEKSKTSPFVYQMTPNIAFETTEALNWNPSGELSNTPGMIEIHVCVPINAKKIRLRRAPFALRFSTSIILVRHVRQFI